MPADDRQNGLPGAGAAGYVDITAARILRGMGAALGKMGGRLAGVPCLLLPCRRVHTCCCPAPLDVVYLDRSGHVLVVETLPPWRLGRRVRHCYAVLELDAGQAAQWQLAPGVQCRHAGWLPS